MYKIVIADDEKIIRDTLLCNFKQEKYAMFEAFEASDGEDALRIARNIRPDIVITDVKMPVIDGLQLSSIIKEEAGDTVVIVLSGFNEFTLVRRALGIGVFDYLLKPIKEDELDSVVRKAVELVESRKYKKLQENILKQKINEGNLAIKEKLLNNLAMSGYDEAAYLKLKTLNLKIDFRNYFTAVFGLKEEGRNEAVLRGFNLELLRFSINNIIDECSKVCAGRYELFATSGNMSVLVIEDMKCDSDQSARLIQMIKGHVNNFLNAEVFVGMSRNHEGVRELGKAYQEAYEKVEMKMFLGKDEVCTGEGAIYQLPDSIFGQKEKLFANSIYLCDSGKVKEIVNELFGLAGKMHLSLRQLKYLNMHIINCILEIARDIGYDADSAADGGKSLYERVDEVKSIELVKAFILETTGSLIEAIRAKNSDKRKKTLESILNYIEQHYNEELTLYKISEKFFIEYSYLSKMFKEQAGKLFSKYLIDLRIRKARELLTVSGKKIYEISEEVGYTDIRYFTKLFKELEGITPMEYRRSKGIAGVDRGDMYE